MTKLIVVCGATGALGGSTARRMLQEGWQVRAITRNKTSPAAKALADAGAELDTASYDDTESLSAAFKGANAVFAVTNMFDNIMELGQEGAGEKEYNQMMKIAEAAGKTSTLEHLVLHTLPSGEKMAGKGFYVPHMDNKDRAADEIKKSMPELAKKTTFLWLGLFASNFYTFPMMTPIELPNSYGSYIYIQPCKPDSWMFCAGDTEKNVGTFVHAILSKPEISLPAKYAFAYSDALPFNKMLESWSEVTGKRSTFVECTQEEYGKMWGIFGVELALQFKALEAQPDWTVPYKGDVVTAKELGIKAEELVNLKDALVSFKETGKL
ncbi:hypothetical protein LTR97_004313 [Elasticomyces elasticus]|uniref:NmrA-like domain-containing protein n=1 Tax=Elasticomyces elasticus TaxID=574655 RepID=A0AAN8A274_9PEZI|nr:hypothetical protein LTR97_004313 [Elasticomyces elasticus]